MRIKLLIISTITLGTLSSKIYGQATYLDYHKEVTHCEVLISLGQYKEAVTQFDSLFYHYDFVFLRECKLAAQLSAYTKDRQLGLKFIRLGILNGWVLKDLEKDSNLKLLREGPQWKNIQYQYDSLHSIYLDRINNSLKQQVHQMYKNDQKKALGTLFRIGDKSQERYAENKFAPHSEKQMTVIDTILNQYGYPGEKLIGNNMWGSVILSHHNSISASYNAQDTLYHYLKPRLLDAIDKGELSPYIFAVIEDWGTAALNGHNLTVYGFLGAIPNESILKRVNEARREIGMRNIDLRNSLIDVEGATGMNLYLQKDWQKGKITISN